MGNNADNLHIRRKAMVRKFYRESDRSKVKEVRDESGVLQRMVAITSTGQILLTDKRRKAILVRNRPQGGSFYAKGLED